MKVQTISEYLMLLEGLLQKLPKGDRELQIAEVKDHLLQSLLDDQKSEGEIISNFLSPEELSNRILSEYNELYGSDSTSLPHTKQRKSKLKIALIIIIVLLVIWVLLFWGLFTFNKQEGNNGGVVIIEEIIEE